MIHRPRYDDWSIPKGKLDPGETAPVAAVREIFEETGQRAHLGRRLASVATRFPATKVVRYSRRAVAGGDFEPNKEVDDVLWLPLKEAAERLSYPLDRKVLRRFVKTAVRHPDRADRAAWHRRAQGPLQG